MNISKIVVGLVASAFIGSAFAQQGPRPGPAPDADGSVKHKKAAAYVMGERHAKKSDHETMRKIAKAKALQKAKASKAGTSAGE